jgi:hypothetical protein
VVPPLWDFHHCQVVGRKRWLICPSEAAAELYVGSTGGGVSPIDAFEPDMKRFPKFARAKCFDVLANPGDILFYPRKWFHQTLNLDPVTVGIAGRRIDSTNYNEGQPHTLPINCPGAAIGVNLTQRFASLIIISVLLCARAVCIGADVCLSCSLHALQAPLQHTTAQRPECTAPTADDMQASGLVLGFVARGIWARASGVHYTNPCDARIRSASVTSGVVDQARVPH